jgi:hypothetical protein
MDPTVKDAERALRKLGERVRLGQQALYPVTESELETFRAAFREGLKEQQGAAPEGVKPEGKSGTEAAKTEGTDAKSKT